MAVTHTTGANGGKVAIGTAINTELAGGSILLLTAADATLATLSIGTGGDVPTVDSSSGVIDFCPGSFELEDTNASAGTCTKASFRDSGGTQEIFQCTVGQGSGDISFDDNTFESGQTVKITALTYTPPT